MLSADDILQIQRLINLYGHIIDERQFSRVAELFTEDTLYDVSDFASGVHRGAAAIAALWADSEAKHPLAHHATNIVVTEDRDGTARVVSKGSGVRRDGTVGTVVYRDLVERGVNGWRITERIAIRRRPEIIPPPS